MKRFTMTEQHLTLLRHAYVRWWDAEWGAPCIDPKRPYGNGDMIQSIMKLVGEIDNACPHCHEPLDEADGKRYVQLHKETTTALQIILTTGSFVAGEYECSAYGIDWKLSTERE